MSARFLRIASALVLVITGLFWLRPGLGGQTQGQPSTKSGDWRHYSEDMRGTRYWQLDQIKG